MQRLKHLKKLQADRNLKKLQADIKSMVDEALLTRTIKKLIVCFCI